MPKVLCLTALVISILVFLMFFFDLVLNLLGMTSLAPFKGAHLGIDVVFVICAAIIGVMSFLTFRQQV
jgi:hypothetical protein